MLKDPLERKLPVTRSNHYAITVEGQVDRRWTEWFDGWTMTYTDAGETVLSGPVTDQAALHGLLIRIRDLNLTLIAVMRSAD